MIVYLDTSIIIASLTPEEATPRVTLWLKQDPARAFAISAWVRTEVSAALSIKLRDRKIDERMRYEALSIFNRLADETFRIVPIPPGCFELAARLADSHETGLRAGDALHLAIASMNSLPLCTLDKRMAGAGLKLGLGTQLI